MDRLTKDDVHPKILQKLLEDSDITIEDASFEIDVLLLSHSTK